MDPRRPASSPFKRNPGKTTLSTGKPSDDNNRAYRSLETSIYQAKGARCRAASHWSYPTPVQSPTCSLAPPLPPSRRCVGHGYYTTKMERLAGFPSSDCLFQTNNCLLQIQVAIFASHVQCCNAVTSSNLPIKRTASELKPSDHQRIPAGNCCGPPAAVSRAQN